MPHRSSGNGQTDTVPASSGRATISGVEGPTSLLFLIVATVLALVLANIAAAALLPEVMRARHLAAVERSNVEVIAHIRAAGSAATATDGVTRTISLPPAEAAPLSGNDAHSRLVSENGRRHLVTSVADGGTDCENCTAEALDVDRDVEADLSALDQFADRIVVATAAASLLIVFALLCLLLQSRRRASLHKALMRRLETAAYTDSMTGLLSRGRFMELAETLIRAPGGCHLFVVDVDRFKEINDEYGHAAGDAVIREVAHRIRSVIRPEWLAGRLGGDEFVLMLPAAEAETAENTGRALVAAIGKPFVVERRSIALSASAGRAESRDGCGSLDQLIIDADTALYRAKQSGRNRCIAFDVAMNDGRLRRRRIERLILRALGEDGFEYRFQPLYDAASGRLHGFETLLRLRDDTGGYIPPAEVTTVAEGMRCVVEIGERVLREAIAFAALLPSTVRIGVNLSPRQFGARNERGQLLEEALAGFLAEAGLSARRLALEVTEGALLAENDTAVTQLNALRAMGCIIALDDFGAGSASLSHLWKFAFSTIKISQSFARGLRTNAVELSEIVRSIVNMSHTLGIRVIAEGIETPEEATFFRDAGCDLLQGYLLGQPASLSEAPAIVLADARGERPAGWRERAAA